MLILTEYCSGSNLNERRNRPSRRELNIEWMSQMSDAVAYLHSRNGLHRDLKPENVSFFFGLAREYITLKTNA